MPNLHSALTSFAERASTFAGCPRHRVSCNYSERVLVEWVGGTIIDMVDIEISGEKLVQVLCQGASKMFQIPNSNRSLWHFIKLIRSIANAMSALADGVLLQKAG
jgi:hypothetical protein